MSVHDRLRAGAAVFNAGHRHAAHDLWEEHWLTLRDRLAAAGESPPATVEAASREDRVETPSLAADERLLHGLIQFTAAVHHHESDNPAGAAGLAESAAAYLGPLPADYRDCSLAPVRSWLAAAADDPTPGDPPPLEHGDQPVSLDALDVEAAALAAPVVAEATGYDPDVLAAAADYAREEVTEGRRVRFVTLVFDFVAGADRDVVFRRLDSLVDRRRRRDRDVDGLF